MLLYLPDISSNPALFSSGSCVSNLCIDLGRADLLSSLSLVFPVSLSDLPHGIPAYPWFLIGRPGCCVRDEFGCTTENSLLNVFHVLSTVSVDVPSAMRLLWNSTMWLW